MSNKLLTKNFNFIGFGVLNVTMVGSGAELALQPFLVSKTKNGMYEAVALNFGTVALGLTEDDAIRNVSLSIFTYGVSFVQANAPLETISRAKYMADFFAEYARLSMRHSKAVQKMLAFSHQNETTGSYTASGYYYQSA